MPRHAGTSRSSSRPIDFCRRSVGVRVALGGSGCSRRWVVLIANLSMLLAQQTVLAELPKQAGRDKRGLGDA
ncbi:MAG TPA: hypothetical protein VK137_08270, partial [Planctomycetaceae bacterium]|nr:hypothetical protein [Planctomycetaceae bacterium]